MNEIKEYTEKMFEDIKHIDDKGNVHWEACTSCLDNCGRVLRTYK